MNQLPATEAFPHTTQEMPAQAGPPAAEQLPNAARKVQPLHLALAGGLVLVVAGGAAFALTRSGGDEPSTVARPPASRSAAVPSVSGSPLPSLIGVGVAPTRNPFVVPGTTGPAATTGTSGTAGGGSGGSGGSTTTVTATTRVTNTVTATRTTTATATTTVTANPTYVFVASWSGAQVSLVVNDSAPAPLNPGQSTSGVTYFEQDIAQPTCAKVKKTGAADATAVLVCEGQSIKLT